MKTATEPNLQPLLEVKGLKRYFIHKNGWAPKQLIKAVDGVDFTLNRKETLGLVGESGCGKSTLGRLILQLIPPTTGRIVFEGSDMNALKKNKLRLIRRKMQMIFQDPLGSLDPRMTVGEQIDEPLMIHGMGNKARRVDLAVDILNRVGLHPDMLTKYAHQLSGGQRQRIVAARALVLKPSVLVCDEPVSALDVSIQAQTINMLQDIQENMGVAYLFISHDLRIVQHISHRVAIMYAGRLVEVAPAKTLFKTARHPYTRALIASVPLLDPMSKRPQEPLQGEPPSPIDRLPGCPFQPRCRVSQPVCRVTEPSLLWVGDRHLTACHLT